MREALTCLLMLAAFQCRGARAEATNDEQIALLSAGLQETASQLGWIRYTAEYRCRQSSSARGPASNELSGTVTIARHGGLLYVVKTTKPNGRQSQRVVVNNEYTAVWWPVTTAVEQFDHTSTATDTPGVEELVRGATAFDLLSYGVGFGKDASKIIAPFKAPEGATMVVSNEAGTDGAYVFRVDVKSTRGGRAVYIVDPNRGFLITELKILDRNNQLHYHVQVVPEQIHPSGVWVPSRVTDSYSDANRHEKVSLTATAIEFHPDLTSDVFTLRGMGLPDGLMIHRKLLSGAVEASVYMHGESIPREVVNELKSEQKRVNELESLRTARRGNRSFFSIIVSHMPYGMLVGALLVSAVGLVWFVHRMRERNYR